MGVGVIVSVLKMVCYLGFRQCWDISRFTYTPLSDKKSQTWRETLGISHPRSNGHGVHLVLVGVHLEGSTVQWNGLGFHWNGLGSNVKDLNQERASIQKTYCWHF